MLHAFRVKIQIAAVILAHVEPLLIDQLYCVIRNIVNILTLCNPRNL